MTSETIVDRLRDTLAGFAEQSPDRGEFERLRSFYDRMKREGVATTRPYDLPPLDTIGRSAVRNRQPE